MYAARASPPPPSRPKTAPPTPRMIGNPLPYPATVSSPRMLHASPTFAGRLDRGVPDSLLAQGMSKEKTKIASTSGMGRTKGSRTRRVGLSRRLTNITDNATIVLTTPTKPSRDIAHLLGWLRSAQGYPKPGGTTRRSEDLSPSKRAPVRGPQKRSESNLSPPWVFGSSAISEAEGRQYEKGGGAPLEQQSTEAYVGYPDARLDEHGSDGAAPPVKGPAKNPRTKGHQGRPQGSAPARIG